MYNATVQYYRLLCLQLMFLNFKNAVYNLSYALS